MEDDDLNRQLFLADAAVAEGQAQLESFLVVVAKMSRDGIDTVDGRRQLNFIEEILRRDVELRDRLRERLRADRMSPDASN